MARQNEEERPEPIHLIVTGGAGVGKSNVIRAVSKWGEKILRKAGDHPNKPRILLMAPTGMAASVIGRFLQNVVYSGKLYHGKFAELFDVRSNVLQTLCGIS
jgi:hypothetical protein